MIFGGDTMPEAYFFRGIAYRLEDVAQAIERHILKTRPQVGY